VPRSLLLPALSHPLLSPPNPPSSPTPPYPGSTWPPLWLLRTHTHTHTHTTEERALLCVALTVAMCV
jgi:hypothetical protein